MNPMILLVVIPIAYTLGMLSTVFFMEAKMSDEELEEVYGEAFGSDRKDVR